MTVYTIKPVIQPVSICVYHHPACQCREAYFRKIEAELISEKRYIQFLENKWIEMCTDIEVGQSAGMYEVEDPSYPQVKVGKYTICRQDEKSVWIQTDGGEGGQFSDEAFFATVDKFYRKNL